MANEQQQVSNGQQPGVTTKEGFGETSMTRVAETASAAIAAQAQASVQARYVMAIKQPRDLENVRVRLLKECARPGFADVARYHKPVGKGVEGPSIRFAEAALRCLTNVLPEVAVVYDDSEKRIVRVAVTDLEANLTYSTDVVIEKSVERSSVKEGQTVLGKRMNSQGRLTYIVAATEDDLLNKQNALVSKALRTNALRILPGDILDECMELVLKTQNDRDAKDPDAAKKKVIDAFAQMNIMPGDLKTYLGHEVAQVSPAELTQLRALFAALRDGETTWAEALEHKTGKTQAQEAGKAAGAQADLKDRVKAKAAPKAADPPQESANREPGSDG